MDIRVIMSRVEKFILQLLRYTLYYLRMSEESEIQTEVEALRARFSDTKTLYREVWGLLVFSAISDGTKS